MEPRTEAARTRNCVAKCECAEQPTLTNGGRAGRQKKGKPEKDDCGANSVRSHGATGKHPTRWRGKSVVERDPSATECQRSAGPNDAVAIELAVSRLRANPGTRRQLRGFAEAEPQPKPVDPPA